MRIMRMYEAHVAYGELYLFCSDFCLTKHISKGIFAKNTLIFPHDPHVFEVV
jgi:hypothetical protein